MVHLDALPCIARAEAGHLGVSPRRVLHRDVRADRLARDASTPRGRRWRRECANASDE
jgi:hypothetical protein